MRVRTIKGFFMTVSGHRPFRVLATVFFSIGVLGVVGGTPAAWTLVILAALTSAALLPALRTRPPAVVARTPARLEVIR